MLQLLRYHVRTRDFWGNSGVAQSADTTIRAAVSFRVTAQKPSVVIPTYLLGQCALKYDYSANSRSLQYAKGYYTAFTERQFNAHVTKQD